jgi:hypothetical protein
MQLKEGKFYINRGGDRVFTPLIAKGYAPHEGAMSWQMDGTYARTPGSSFDLVAEFDTREDAIKFMHWQKTMVGKPPTEPVDSENNAPDPTQDILHERARTHGDYAAMAKTFDFWARTAINRAGIDKMNAGQKFAFMMVMVKLARIANGDPDYVDHWDDVAGYARLGRDSKGEG